MKVLQLCLTVDEFLTDTGKKAGIFSTCCHPCLLEPEMKINEKNCSNFAEFALTGLSSAGRRAICL